MYGQEVKSIALGHILPPLMDTTLMFGDVSFDLGLGFLTVLVSLEGLAKHDASFLSDARVIVWTINLITFDMILTSVNTRLDLFDKEKHLISQKTGMKDSLWKGEIMIISTLVVSTNRVAVTITLHHLSIVVCLSYSLLDLSSLDKISVYNKKSNFILLLSF